MDATRRLPAELVEHARAFAAGGRAAVTPRDASTVVLLRSDPGGPGGPDGASGPGGVSGRGVQAYLLRRHAGMPFAGGMVAFPGGGVDLRDSDGVVAWAGPSAGDFAARLGCAELLARALVCAAVRETYEEAGVLLAGPTAASVVGDTSAADWEADRRALVDRSLAFSDFLDRRGLVLRADLLAPWARWITPDFEPRRYDARFFVAALPAGQRTRDVSGEADLVTWMRPVDATAAVDTGRLRMLPPTYVVLSEIAGFQSPAQALVAAADRVIRPVQPTARIVGDQGWLSVEL
ncbi:MAG: NUDIX hydrolase [Nocardioidaceae bacterium]